MRNKVLSLFLYLFSLSSLFLHLLLAAEYSKLTYETWVLGGSDAQAGNAIALDRRNYFYITGYTNDVLDVQAPAGSTGVYFAKFSPNGTMLSLRQFGTIAGGRGAAVGTDSRDNVYVSGSIKGDLSGQSNVGALDAVLMKLHPENGSAIFTRLLGSTQDDEFSALAFDSNDNIFVAGYCFSSVNGIPSNGNQDVLIAKYSQNGSQLFVHVMGTPSNDLAFGIAVDAMDNVFVMGRTEGSFDNQPPIGMKDFFLVKLANNGTKIFTKLLGTDQVDFPRAISIDYQGFVYLVGHSNGSIAGAPNAGGSDILLLKVSNNGTQIYSRLLGSPKDETATSISINPRGYVYVSGFSTGDLCGQKNTGSSDVFLAKYSPSGALVYCQLWGTVNDDKIVGLAAGSFGDIYLTGCTTGSFGGQVNHGSWDILLVKAEEIPLVAKVMNFTKRIDSSGNDVGYGVAVDSRDNVFFAGQVGGSLNGLAAYGDTDILMMKYNSTGNRIYARVSGTTGGDMGFGIAIDSADVVFVAGLTAGSIDGQAGFGGNDMVLIKYDNNGTKIYTRVAGSSAHDAAYGVAVDPADNVYLTGFTFGVFDNHTNAGSADIVIVKYANNGTKLFSVVLGSSGTDWGRGIASDSQGMIYVAGHAEGSIAGQTYSGDADIVLIKMDGDGTILFVRMEGNAYFNEGYSVAIDGNDSIYLAGTSLGLLNGQVNNHGIDAFVMKYASNGTRIFTVLSGVEGNDYGTTVAIDRNNNVHVGGFVGDATNVVKFYWQAFSSNGTSLFVSIWRLSGTSYNSYLYSLSFTARNCVVMTGFVNQSSWSAVLMGQFVRDMPLPSTYPTSLELLGSTGDDYGTSIASDSLDNVFITGKSQSPILDEQVNSGSSDIFLVKFAPNGYKIFTRLLGTSGDDVGSGLAIDSSDNIYICGQVGGALDDQVYSGGGSDIVLVKYNREGSKVYTRLLGTPSIDRAYAIAVDSNSSHVYMVGGTRGTLSGNTGYGNLDAFLVKFSVAGNWIYTRLWGSTLVDQAASIAMDPFGFVYAAGYAGGTLDGQAISGTNNAFLIKFDGSTGQKIFMRLFGGSTNSFGKGVVIDSSLDIYVMVSFSGTLLSHQTVFGDQDGLLLKYSNDGNLLWAAPFGSAGTDELGALVHFHGNADSILITGYTNGAIFDGLPNAGNNDIFLIQFDGDGTKLSSALYGTSSDDYGADIAMDGSNNIVLTGYTSGNLGGNINGGGLDAFYMKATNNFTLAPSFSSRLTLSDKFLVLFGTSGDDDSCCMATDHYGNLYVVGTTTAALGGQPYSGGSDVYLMKLDIYRRVEFVREFGSSQDDQVFGVATDSSNSVYIVGSTLGSFDGQINAGNQDAFMVKYGSDGTKLSTVLFGTMQNDIATAVATDSHDDIYVVGRTKGTWYGQRNVGGFDVFIMKFAANGSKLEDNVYVVGTTYGNLDGEVNAGGADIFLQKYASNGTRIFTRLLGSSSDDVASGVRIDNSVYITGTTLGSLGGQPKLGGSDVFLVKYSYDGVKQYTKLLGTSGNDLSPSITTDAQGHMLLRFSSNQSLTGPTAGGFDAFLFMLDYEGELRSVRSFCSSNDDYSIVLRFRTVTNYDCSWKNASLLAIRNTVSSDVAVGTQLALSNESLSSSYYQALDFQFTNVSSSVTRASSSSTVLDGGKNVAIQASPNPLRPSIGSFTVSVRNQGQRGKKLAECFLFDLGGWKLVVIVIFI
eukprot:scaffold988_cov165-Ochromonas_danica.AAC.7